jgi:hypothetical protein
VKTNLIAQDSGWNVSFWFAVSSPLLGVLVGISRGGNFLPMTEVMSVTPIILVLIILLFGFDSSVSSALSAVRRFFEIF